MTATVTENDNLPIGEFTPFNDTDGPRVQQAVQEFGATQGYDTSVIDRFRQGVSMRLPRHVYQTIQPKIWSGRLDHQVRVITIGQARSFTQFENSPIFEEQPEFDPVWYIEDPNYPLPIVFNNGPQQEEEAIIEPFTIPMRKNTNEGPFYPHSVRGSLEDGNGFDDLVGGVNRVEQFISYNAPLDPNFFLDEGQAYIGTFPTASHLNTRYQPVALFRFNNNLDDFSGNGKQIELVSGSLVFDSGPFEGSQALSLDGNTSFSSSLDADLQIASDLTIQAFIKPANLSPSVIAGFGQFAVSIGNTGESLDTNVLGSLVINQGSSGSVGFDIERATGTNFKGTTTSSLITNNQWYHLVTSRQGSTTSIYLNGSLVGTFVHENFPEKASSGNQQKLWIGTQPAGAGNLEQLAFSGSISNVKIIDRALSQQEIQSEYARVFPVQGGAVNEALSNSIILEGFTPVIIRNIDPFDDTRDERIVERLTIGDQDFLDAVKRLDFDLSEDIRGTFDRKSATAGGDVYGPYAAIYGTDSITYRGLFRGA